MRGPARRWEAQPHTIEKEGQESPASLAFHPEAAAEPRHGGDGAEAVDGRVQT